jgi:DNA-binding CsgD family transcriptional regulator
MLENVHIHVLNDKGVILGELEGTLASEHDMGDNDSARMLIDLLRMLRHHCIKIELSVCAFPDSEFDEHKIRSKLDIIRKSRLVEVLNGLTSREKEVVMLLLRGMTTKEIADKMFISLNTAKTHKKNIFSKTGVRRSSDLSKLCNPYY